MTWPARYACAPSLDAAVDDYVMRPIAWADREPIRDWRNSQLDVLRQREPLTPTAQDRYFREVVEPQFAMPRPPQVLVAVAFAGALVGYGGVVHIDWDDRRGEVSFLTDPSRLDADRFGEDWRAYLAMLVPAARNSLGLHRLTTEAYAFREDLFPILEQAGFEREGILRQQRLLGGRWVDSVVHGLVLS